MSRLALTNKVLFIAPPFYIHDVLRSIWKKGNEPSGLKRITENLYSYASPRYLPTNYRYPRLEQVTNSLRCQRIRKRMASLGMARPILYLWNPEFVDMIGCFDESLAVYHCYDEYGSFDSVDHARQPLSDTEQRLLKHADIVFAASQELSKRRRALNPNVHCVENGVNYPLFSKAQDPATAIPKDMLEIPRPVIGCVTTQTPFIDFPLLQQVFERRPDWSFVFIGVDRTPLEQAGEALTAFQSLPNVHFIGRRSQDALPGYLKACDVCTIPWILNDVTLVSSSPLKLYEYLAAGKPVVCKPLPLMQHLAGIVGFATTPGEWISAIETALVNDSVEHIQERQSVASRNTWDQRTAEISQRLMLELSIKKCVNEQGGVAFRLKA
jgi:glycosyltransferase involved in cell wall biosynthesis